MSRQQAPSSPLAPQAPAPGAQIATPTATVADLLVQARRAGLERLDAQLLLGKVLQQPRAWLIAHGDHALDAKQTQNFMMQLAERARGVPLAYLLGEREFHGLLLRVTPDVLVPRADTEVLVDWALELLGSGAAHALAGHGEDEAPNSTRHPTVVDLGTGSGAIALALKKARPEAQVCAVDLSEAALAVARGNGERLGLTVQWLQGHWCSPLGERRFDLIVSNPPYIAADDPHLPALHAEPLTALTPGGNGLSALRELCAQAPAHLIPAGWLLLEHGFDQATAVRRLLQDAGFDAVQTRRDLAGHERCTGGLWPGAGEC